MTPAIEAIKAELEAIVAEIDAKAIETLEGTATWYARRAAWHHAQGNIERAEYLGAKAAEWREKIKTYKANRRAR